MAEVTRDGVHVDRAPTRYPFCHESVAPVDADWVACAGCLGRHHTACWNEAGACGACGGSTRLTAAEADARPAAGAVGAREAGPAFTPVEAGPDDVARARREAASVFEEGALRDASWTHAVLGPLTLGILPMVTTERRLAEHDAATQRAARPLPEGLDPSLAKRITDDRARRLSTGQRRAIGFGAVVASAALVLAVALLRLLTLERPYGYEWEGTQYIQYIRTLHAFEVTALVSWIVTVLGIGGYLHAVREAVRAHELRQLYEVLVLGAAPKAKAEELLRRTSEGWGARRLADTLITLGALHPIFAIVLIPVMCLRMSGVLGLHRRNEAILDEQLPPRSGAKTP